MALHSPGGGSGTFSGSLAATQVAFGSGANAIAGDAGFTYSTTNKAVTLGGATITADAPIFNLSQTWNNAGVTFTGFKSNITSTASAAGSLLFDFQLATVSVLNLNKSGQLNLPGNGTTSGTAALPAITFAAANNGIYSSNAANVIISANGVAMANFTGAAGFPAILPQAGNDLGADLGYTSGFWRNIYAGTLTAKSVAPTVAAGQIGYGATVAATASAGGGGVIPATVEGYIIVNIAGTARKVAYYAT